MIVPTLERSRANRNLGPDITKPVVGGRYFIARPMAFLRAKQYL
jgi:hypothetical protein